MKPCPETFPYPLIVLDETDSTNRYISQLCNNPQKAVAELTTVSAEFQTAGKGQRGNSWEAEKKRTCFSALCSTLPFWRHAASSFYHSDHFFIHQRGAGQVVGRNHDKVAQRYLLEGQEDMRHTDRE